MVQLPVSRDVNIRQKSKMAAAKMKCTYFTALWLTYDNFKYTVSDFQCPRQRCADPGMTLMTDMGNTKMAAETGSSINHFAARPLSCTVRRHVLADMVIYFIVIICLVN